MRQKTWQEIQKPLKISDPGYEYYEPARKAVLKAFRFEQAYANAMAAPKIPKGIKLHQNGNFLAYLGMVKKLPGFEQKIISVGPYGYTIHVSHNTGEATFTINEETPKYKELCTMLNLQNV